MEIVYEILSVINGITVSASTQDETGTKTINFIIDEETNKVVGSIVQYLEPKHMDETLTKEDVSFKVK